jgi:rSAM/selenodomain-associated transferase 1
MFAKAPVPGAVKTRLIPAIGKHNATVLHAAMVTHSVALAAQNANHHVQLWCTPDTTHSLFIRLRKNYPLTLHVQKGQDLGQRMQYAFEQTLKEFDAALIVGTDCPTITVELLDQALQALYKDKDAVIAPAVDGGYVLLGLKKVYVELFTRIAWGTDQVFAQTQQRLNRLPLTWQLLDTQWDVDRSEDLQRLAKDKSRFAWHPDLRDAVGNLQLNPAK